jgi:hypothetical protein
VRQGGWLISAGGAGPYLALRARAQLNGSAKFEPGCACAPCARMILLHEVESLQAQLEAAEDVKEAALAALHAHDAADRAVVEGGPEDIEEAERKEVYARLALARLTEDS